MVVYNCSCLADDLAKIFEAYWYLGQSDKPIPAPWPSSFSTSYNKDTPLQLPLNGTDSTVYLSVSISGSGVKDWSVRPQVTLLKEVWLFLVLLQMLLLMWLGG